MTYAIVREHMGIEYMLQIYLKTVVYEGFFLNLFLTNSEKAFKNAFFSFVIESKCITVYFSLYHRNSVRFFWEIWRYLPGKNSHYFETQDQIHRHISLN